MNPTRGNSSPDDAPPTSTRSEHTQVRNRLAYMSTRENSPSDHLCEIVPVKRPTRKVGRMHFESSQCPACVARNTCAKYGKRMLSDSVVVLHGPLCVASGTANGWLKKGGVADTQHTKLSWQAIQVEAKAVERAQQLRPEPPGAIPRTGRDTSTWLATCHFPFMASIFGNPRTSGGVLGVRYPPVSTLANRSK